MTISGLTLTRGDYQLGAAIAIQGGRVTLNGDSFTANVSGGSNTGSAFTETAGFGERLI